MHFKNFLRELENLQNLPGNNDFSLSNISEESTLTNFQNSLGYQELLQNTAQNIFNNSINPFCGNITNSDINKAESPLENSLESLSEIQDISEVRYQINITMNNYQAALKTISSFSGKSKDIPLFLATCKLAYDSVNFGELGEDNVIQPPNTITEEAFILSLKTKLDGITYSSLKSKNLKTFAEFETAINEQFRLLRPASKIFSENAKLCQRPGEDTIHYVNRLDDLFTEYQQSIKFMEKIEDETSMIPLIAHINKQLIFNGINGLLQPMRTIAKSRNFTSFEEFSKWAYQQSFDQSEEEEPKSENINSEILEEAITKI